MKATSKTTQQAPFQVTPDPKMVMLREVIPWLLVAIFAFSVAGVITGWFIHASVATDFQTEMAIVSKDLSR